MNRSSGSTTPWLPSKSIHSSLPRSERSKPLTSVKFVAVESQFLQFRQTFDEIVRHFGQLVPVEVDNLETIDPLEDVGR